jgi:hypothetical protein
MDSKASARWAPLSYPSAAIFSSSRGRGGGGGERATRVADPLFPLHRDVLLAAVRELLIIDGKIDHRTMEIMTNRDADGDGIAAAVIDEKEGTRRPSVESERIDHMDARSSNNETNAFSPVVEALRAEVASVNSLASVRKESELECSQPRPHVVPIGVDQQECNFDHKRFCNAEALVRYAVNRAMLIPSGEWSENDNSVRSSAINMERPDASVFIASKRKVSDASDDSELKHDSYSDFSPCVVSLVRSNIMLLKTSPLGSKLVRLTPQWGMAFNPTVPTNSEETEHILSFLRHPKLQREQQQDKVCQTIFAIPRLLEASIDDECSMRARAHEIISSIVNSFRGNDMNVPLRAFLGYKSAKSPSRDRILEIISDVLFDVSHAMYAFIHTQEDVTRARPLLSKGVANEMNYGSMEKQIKSSLFDDRALKRIGGFEPASLLPLALGIRRCCQTKTSWEEYARSEEGKMAMSVHSKRGDFPGEQIAKEGISASHGRKRQGGTLTINNPLLELGKKRRGRRGKSMFSSQF